MNCELPFRVKLEIPYKLMRENFSKYLMVAFEIKVKQLKVFLKISWKNMFFSLHHLENVV